MRKLLSVMTLVMLFACQQQVQNESIIVDDVGVPDELEVLLVGTFHFANFNPDNNGDVVQTQVPDVLTEKNQLELGRIADRIKAFNPDKIFVEYPYYAQARLDTIYRSFSKKNYAEVKRNETRQIAFRVGKALNHDRLFAIDLRTSFPLDSLFKEMEKAEQFDLIRADSIEIEQIEKEENELFASNKSLSEILFYFNNNKRRSEDINWYLSLANQGGERTNFVGAYLSSEWYRRNLYMYSLIQKAVERNDKRIMILAGASHIAMFKDFIDYNPKWGVVELEEIMKR